VLFDASRSLRREPSDHFAMDDSLKPHPVRFTADRGEKSRRLLLPPPSLFFEHCELNFLLYRINPVHKYTQPLANAVNLA
jgi:hypothetical protein